MSKAPRIDLTKIDRVDFQTFLACYGGNGMQDVISFTIMDNQNPTRKRLVENFSHVGSIALTRRQFRKMVREAERFFASNARLRRSLRRKKK